MAKIHISVEDLVLVQEVYGKVERIDTNSGMAMFA